MYVISSAFTFTGSSESKQVNAITSEMVLCFFNSSPLHFFVSYKTINRA